MGGGGRVNTKKGGSGETARNGSIISWCSANGSSRELVSKLKAPMGCGSLSGPGQMAVWLYPTSGQSGVKIVRTAAMPQNRLFENIATLHSMLGFETGVFAYRHAGLANMGW